jgi:protein-tyrosine phosphatase
VGARPEYLQTAYDCVDKHYGSMDAYIETCVGLDASGLNRLRDRYLTAD